ncbi:MAG: tRNA pseudouridine(13) synthase TruD, partial [Candidatus Hydrothermarchaeaceae archaeon]
TRENPDGEYTHFTLEKTNWETLRAIKELARSLRVSRKRFGFAGTKDRRAITRQRVAVWKVETDALKRVNIKDLKLSDFKKSDERVSLGDAKGNRFKITVRDVAIEGDMLETLLKEAVSQLERRGVPNYFGYQRFGTIRPNTHLVGRELLRGDIKSATLAYLINPFDGEREDAYNARKTLEETMDFKRALELFPKRLGYERSMLDSLSKNPNDYAGALRRLPKKLRWLFIHAYQGYLFNRVLSRALEKGIEIETIPLFGYETVFSDGEQSDIEMAVIEEEGISLENFDITSMPELSMEGQYRDAFIKVRPKFTVNEDGYTCEFDLPRGSYATVVLREFMKADPLSY